MAASLIIHGHFYQPPRENPWIDQVEREPGAEPFHDWNERIFFECYRPNSYARILDDQGRVERIVNNYVHLSFNFGPTLLSWLERHHTITYGRILAADRESAKRRRGHGNALAQAYNHAILPLCNARDRRTQVKWGLYDFRHRFGRDAAGLWLAETAANHECLEVLIEAGVRFTVLSPYQALRVRPFGGAWRDASGGRLDSTRPYRYFHRNGSGRYLDIFFYDGPRSKSIAFEGALATSRGFLDNLIGGAPSSGVVTVATDGETYGHHFKFGDRCLAHALEYEAQQLGVQVTNFGAYLEEHPPTEEVELWLGEDGLGSSWSCAHGVGRWYRDCGCSTGSREGWNQKWRRPLREALDYLRDRGAELFEGRGAEYFHDPWAARDDYIQLLLEPEAELRGFLERHQRRPLSGDALTNALTLLELQQHAMLMYTSCGWFFADLAGIEPRQVLKYAGRVIDCFEELGEKSPLPAFFDRLGEARSNADGSGVDIYRRTVDSARVSPRRVAAHLALTSLVDNPDETGELAGWTWNWRELGRRSSGRMTLATGRVELTSTSTRRVHRSAFAALHLGGVDFYCVARDWPDDVELHARIGRIHEAFPTSSLPALLRLVAQELGPEEFGLEHLLPGGKEHVSELVLGGLVRRFAEQYASMYEDHQRTLDMLQSAGFTLPKELTAAAEFTLGRLFEEEIKEQRESQDPAAYRRAVEIAERVAEQGYRIDRTASSRLFEHMITHSVHIALARPSAESLNAARDLLELADRLGLVVNLERAQEAVYYAPHSEHPELEQLAQALKLSPLAFNRR